jgi:hypothetical protein
MAGFPHRHNKDGTFDSICPRCYKTVANGQSEVNLAIAEMQHTCHPLELLQLQTKLINYRWAREEQRRKV